MDNFDHLIDEVLSNQTSENDANKAMQNKTLAEGNTQDKNDIHQDKKKGEIKADAWPPVDAF